MTFRTIAVHLDSHASCANRIALAGDLAQRYGSHLLGLAPTGAPDLVLDLNVRAADGAEVVALAMDELLRRAEATASFFTDRCSALGVAHEAQVVMGGVADTVVRHGRASDLIVVGQTDRARPADGVPLNLPQDVLLGAGPPVLVVPWTGRCAPVGRRVLVAWKDAREAAVAVHAALPLLRVAERVVVVEVGGTASGMLDGVRAWLSSHGAACETRTVPDLGAVGEQVLSLGADLGADLIVAGGYGHSRLREWLLGGVTRHLLEHMTVPTFLAH